MVRKKSLDCVLLALIGVFLWAHSTLGDGQSGGVAGGLILIGCW